MIPPALAARKTIAEMEVLGEAAARARKFIGWKIFTNFSFDKPYLSCQIYRVRCCGERGKRDLNLLACLFRLADRPPEPAYVPRKQVLSFVCRWLANNAAWRTLRVPSRFPFKSGGRRQFPSSKSPLRGKRGDFNSLGATPSSQGCLAASLKEMPLVASLLASCLKRHGG